MALQVAELLPSFVSTVAPPTLTVDWGTSPAGSREEVRAGVMEVVSVALIIVVIVLASEELIVEGGRCKGDDLKMVPVPSVVVLVTQSHLCLLCVKVSSVGPPPLIARAFKESGGAIHVIVLNPTTSVVRNVAINCSSSRPGDTVYTPFQMNMSVVLGGDGMAGQLTLFSQPYEVQVSHVGVH